MCVCLCSCMCACACKSTDTEVSLVKLIFLYNSALFKHFSTGLSKRSRSKNSNGRIPLNIHVIEKTCREWEWERCFRVSAHTSTRAWWHFSCPHSRCKETDQVGLACLDSFSCLKHFWVAQNKNTWRRQIQRFFWMVFIPQTCRFFILVCVYILNSLKSSAEGLKNR